MDLTKLPDDLKKLNEPPQNAPSKQGNWNNAPEIANELASAFSEVIKIIPVSDTVLVFVLDLSKTSLDADTTENNIKKAVGKLAAAAKAPAAGASQSGKPTQAEAIVVDFDELTLPSGRNDANNALDIATALTSWPQVLSANAVSDRKLVFVVDVSPISGANVPQSVGPITAQLKKAVTQLAVAKLTPATSLHTEDLEPGNGNAPDIAAKLTGTIPGVLSIIPAGNSKLLFLLDQTPDNRFPSKPRDLSEIKIEINKAVETLELPYPNFYLVPFPLATGKNCDVANALYNQIPGVLKIAAVGTTRLAFTIDPRLDKDKLHELEDRIDNYVRVLAEPATPLAANTETFVVPLFYHHDQPTLTAIANYIHTAYPEVNATPITADSTIVLSSTLVSQFPRPLETRDQKRDPIDDARRMIALIDQPEPQVLIETWSIQLSSKNRERIDDVGQKIEEVAQNYGRAVDKSSLLGWQYLIGKLGESDFLCQSYNNYLTGTSSTGTSSTGTSSTGTSSTCPLLTATPPLGYRWLFDPLPQNFINMLLALVASSNPSDNANKLINKMETGYSEKNGAELGRDEGISCQDRDYRVYRGMKDMTVDMRDKKAAENEGAKPQLMLQLECVRDALTVELFAPRSAPQKTSALGQFRAAVADYLYWYQKTFGQVEKDKFDPYLFSQAAEAFDAQLNPFVEAFSSDLATLHRRVAEQVTGLLKGKRLFEKDVQYAASGIVSLKVVAGNPASAVTQTQNYFDATPTATLGDVAAAIQSGLTSSGTQPLPSLLTRNMTTNQATAALAALQAMNHPPVVANIGKGLNLTAQAYRLSGAQGAEMDVTVDTYENGAETITAPTASSETSTSTKIVADDLASRVARHAVTTRVRLHSLNLFDLSTMESVLVRGKTPWKPFDPAIEIPLLGELVKRPRKPDVTYHRSFVFLNTLIVPTAGDVARGARFTGNDESKEQNAHDDLMYRFASE